VPSLTDLPTVRALLETDRAWAVYALGDLCPARLPHCTWLHAHGPAPALALLYAGFAPPVLFALGAAGDLRPLLDEIARQPELYLHVRPDLMPLLAQRYHIPQPRHMWRLLLAPASYRPSPSPGAARLSPADVEALERLYADGEASGEAPGFFSASMLDEGVYFGAWESGELTAAAGTHLVVPEVGVAAVGNVYTRRDRRGRGLAAGLTSAVCSELLARGLPAVALNVAQDNRPALRLYQRLGFALYCDFVEGLAVRR
jgi:GNAT superfamily N-acetyltransferase